MLLLLPLYRCLRCKCEYVEHADDDEHRYCPLCEGEGEAETEEP